MNEDFVPFELAKKLKEKGFDESCYQKYDDEGYLSFNHIGYINCDKSCDDFCALAPTISQVLKWLREEKKIYIEIFLYNGKYCYFVKSITQICKDDLFHECLNEDTTEEEYDSYEQAALAGIEYVIDNLI